MLIDIDKLEKTFAKILAILLLVLFITIILLYVV